MSALESQVIQNIYGQPEDILLTVLRYLKNNTKPEDNTENSSAQVDRTRMTQSGIQRIGIAENEFLYDDDYDLDAYNDEIAKMFGVEA